MSEKANLAASIRQRLLNLARERSQDFQQILVNYALERLLYRLAQSEGRQPSICNGMFDQGLKPGCPADA
jgi:hypothetical protein